ncbi:Mgr1p Ecym_1035 [Eremothecium cymbalariae DBVPG|uniref:Mitochondrial inner membrane i-AAA protease complex subunit MGR1 n=1 Tax=Eremothecium cymbalariae (strain CBS 270.75 / DBVPG 7215 / KCTC 17166 / NRRL Y-17582) TaxID=931890 RepID=G8JM33_ERECY|nr:hypothetical protein Ecym_1035 [Eremothecium cymbalariae DBVPG\
MSLFTPPTGGKGSSFNRVPSKDPEKPEKDIRSQFYSRPSLGLKFWGPLVPASDNRVGLWSLVTAQTLVGLFFMCKFRNLGPKVIKRDISDFPSLNRFSTTFGGMYVTTHLFPEFGGTYSFHRRVGERTGFFYSKRFANIKRVIYLTTGTVLLAQSMLEASRLTLLEYDPWEEQAKCVRDKQFFNDVVKYYHEGVDPMRFKVRDANSGTTLSVNIPEVKQGVAVARAQANAENLVTKWLGPLDYKPLSFSDFLDKLEHNLDMYDILHHTNSKKIIDDTKHASERKAELEFLTEINRKNRERIRTLLDSTPSHSIPLSIKLSDQGIRGVTMDITYDSADDIDLREMWSLHNPWINLALDTSLSIKFLPTVRSPQELIGEGEDVVVAQPRNSLYEDTEPTPRSAE